MVHFRPGKPVTTPEVSPTSLVVRGSDFGVSGRAKFADPRWISHAMRVATVWAGRARAARGARALALAEASPREVSSLLVAQRAADWPAGAARGMCAPVMFHMSCASCAGSLVEPERARVLGHGMRLPFRRAFHRARHLILPPCRRRLSRPCGRSVRHLLRARVLPVPPAYCMSCTVSCLQGQSVEQLSHLISWGVARLRALSSMIC